MTKPNIACKKLCKVFDKQIHALKGIDLELMAEEFVVCIGPSGSGKSTLLHLLAGIEIPDSGTIFYKGESIKTPRRWRELRRRHFGFVFQSFHLIPTLTAQENIELPIIGSGLSSSARKKRIDQLINSVGLENRAKHLPGKLSGGERQRVAIARALINKPSIIFADEPTGNLDTVTSKSIINLLEGLCRNKGTTLLIVTHDQTIAKRANRVIELIDGQLR